MEILEKPIEIERLLISHPIEKVSNFEDSAYEELIFEKEKNVPDFEREPVYDMNSFGGNQAKAELILIPPPQFEDALKTLPNDLLDSFKEILHGEVVGIWPIKSKEIIK